MSKKQYKALLSYIKEQKDRHSYEQSAMSEAQFSSFLDGLLQILNGKED